MRRVLGLAVLRPIYTIEVEIKKPLRSTPTWPN